jgi:hypothetical protein
MGQEMAIMSSGKNRIMIHGPKTDGTYAVELRTAVREALAISIPRTEATVIRHFQGRMQVNVGVPSEFAEVDHHERGYSADDHVQCSNYWQKSQ